MDTEHFKKLERMYLSAPTNNYYHPTIQISEGRAEIAISVKPEFFHTGGAIHGSVYFKLLDDAAYFAVNSLVTDVFVLTVSFNLYLTRPVSEGALKALGTVVSSSKTIFIADSQVFNSKGEQVGRGSGTFVRSKIPLGPEVGYK